MLDPIVTFFKKDQIDNQFYICIKKGQNNTLGHYELEIMNNNTVTLGYNYQTNYYTSSESMKETVFSFIPIGQSLDTNTEITFWMKGKNIIDAKIEGFTKIQYDHGCVFYGPLKNKENKLIELTVKCEVGDYINVGSIIIQNGETKKKEENSNEIMLASNKEICIPVIYDNDFSFITGKIYSNNVKFRFTDENKITKDINGAKIEGEISNGIISIMNIFGYGKETSENGYYCLEDINNGLIIFSIQMTNDNDIPLLFYPPLVPGEIKRHYLKKHQIGIFYGMKPDDDWDEINFNLKSLKGFPDMYYDEYDTFPNCQYTEESIKILTHPYPSNMITVHSAYKSEMENKLFSPISTFQPLMIIYCGEEIQSSLLEDSFCEFETSYFTDKDAIYLPPDNTFSQYLYYDEIDKYKIYLLNKDVDKIYLDMMIFSGDADLILPEYKGAAHKYYLSNKIFYSIHFKNDKPDILEFDAKSNDKTFYMIQYKLLKSDGNDDMNTIESGVNYITSKRYDSSDTSTQTSKHIQFLNFKSEFDDPYLVTFYSPNCLFDVEWVSSEKGDKEKLTTDSYVLQKIINKDSNIYGEKFDFYYTIKKDDDSQYPKKFCMVYASGLELSDPSEVWNKRSISLSEGVTHRYTFNKTYPLIYYSYQISDIKNTLVLNFNLIDKYYFDISIFINNNNVQNTKIYRNSQILFKQKELRDKCEIGGNEFEVCTIVVRIQMQDNYRDRTMEFTMYQIDKNPFYLEKNVVRDDVVIGNNPKHYYFDISDQEYGDITLDFKRGSGFIYVSVEKQNLDKPMDYPDWRGIYHFPTTIEESLKFVTYGKKIIISQANTTKCTDGCYVLITVVSNVRYYGVMDDPDTPFRISINPRIMKIDKNIPIPKVRINVNDFIVGDIISSNDTQRKYDYYSIILPYQSDKVIFDWQADGPSLIINVGNKRPTKDEKDFSYDLLGSDFVYSITRRQILGKLNISDINHSIEGVELTIGIYSDIIDSIDSSPYAFKIFMPPFMAEGSEYIIQMIHIRTDQKVQCLPFKYKDNNICLFAAIVDDSDLKRNLAIYPKSQDDSKVTIYGKLVKAEEVEMNNVVALMKYLEQIFNNAEYKEHKNYVYIEDMKKNESYFFIATAEHDEVIIEVLSSTFTFYNNMNFYPNPSTAQIFAIGDKSINLKFSTTKDLLLNIVCISGIGRFRWSDKSDKDSYYLDGYDDRLTMTTGTDDEEHKLDSLNAISSIVGTPEEYKGGFIFYITYYPRGTVDQLKKNRNTEIQYRTAKMPLNFYVPVNFKNSWTINFIFYNMNLKDNKNFVYNNNLFNIWGTIISDKTASEARYDSKYRPSYDSSCVKGEFDTTFGTLFIDSNYIDKFSEEKNTDNPNIYISIEKVNGVQIDFDSLGFEINIFSNSSKGYNSVQEGLFISGKLSDSDDKKITYLLNCYKDKKYMKIEYTANYNLTQFALSNKPGSEKNDNYKNLEIVEDGGVFTLTMSFDDSTFPDNGEIYFTVFIKENLKPELSHFSFRYSSSDIEPTIIPILSKNESKIKVDISGIDYTVSFKQILIKETSYYIKAYYKEGFIEGENINTIAITESPGEVIQINEPDLTQDEQLSFNISTEKSIKYIKVMARISNGEFKDFFSYIPELLENTPIPEQEIDIGPSDDVIEIPYNYRTAVLANVKNANKKQRYELTFNSINKANNIPNYIKVKAYIEEGTKAPILYFSPIDSNCTNQRVQLAKGGTISNEMWIKREQFEQVQLYVLVECLEENNCNYKLRFSGHDTVVFDSLRFFNYFIDLGNTDMIFTFKNVHNSNGDNITLYATGGKNIEISLDNCDDETCKQSIFTEGAAITTKTTGSRDFTLRVKANFGDYISIGAKIIDKDGRSPENILSTENGQISGFLRKGKKRFIRKRML